jgi:phosphoglycolate phosphatase-like HAD superfamily hydrolase
MNRPRWADCNAWLFDIDGTLLNTRDGVHYQAFHHAVREIYGVDSRIDGVPVHGNTDIGILRAVLWREGVSDREFEARLPAAIEHMCAEVLGNAAAIEPELCPSVRAFLEQLHKTGKLLGVVSGNLEPIGWAKLERAGIREFFSIGCFSTDAELREDIFRLGATEVQKRLGSDACTCVVGDTPSDVDAARKAGLPVISVATGIYTVQELSELTPDRCVSCCTELLAHF